MTSDTIRSIWWIPLHSGELEMCASHHSFALGLPTRESSGTTPIECRSGPGPTAFDGDSMAPSRSGRIAPVCITRSRILLTCCQRPTGGTGRASHRDRQGHPKKLRKQMKSLTWQQIPLQNRTTDKSHGRGEIRRIKVCTVTGPALPHSSPGHRAQAPPGEPPDRKDQHQDGAGGDRPERRTGHPAQLASLIRGHWSVEALHHVRDTTYAEDASPLRAGNAPRAMTTWRNPAIGALCLAGRHAGATALRRSARDATRPLHILDIPWAEIGHTGFTSRPWGRTHDLECPSNRNKLRTSALLPAMTLNFPCRPGLYATRGRS